MKFFADAMLGRLAKRLRLAGFDTAYENWIPDADLVLRAVAEDRTILTRDRRLVLRRAAAGNSLLLRADRVGAQWLEIIQAFPQVTRGPAFSRCAECNALLGEFAKEAARDLVPPYVFVTQPRFWRCQGCLKIYWPGTHIEKIERALAGKP